MKGCIAITGANGYVGRRLIGRAQAGGWEVVALARSRPTGFGGRFVPYALGRRLDEKAVSGAGVAIHLAADIEGRAVSAAEEIASAVQLLDLFSAPARRFVFVSSQAAGMDAPGRYGRVKGEIERHVRAKGGVIARPGQIYGGPARGSFGRLCRIAGLRVVPVPYPSPLIQPVHIDEVCEALLALAGDASLPREINLGAIQPVPFTAFLQAMAHGRGGFSIMPLPVPVRPVLWLLGAAGLVVPSFARMKEQMESLVRLRPMRVEDSLASLKISLRPLAGGMEDWPPAQRRRLLQEAGSLFCYSLGRAPEKALLRRYAKAAMAQNLQPLPRHATGFVNLFLHDAPWLRKAASRLARAEDIRHRLHRALLLGEAAPSTAGLFSVWPETRCFGGAMTTGAPRGGDFRARRRAFRLRGRKIAGSGHTAAVGAAFLGPLRSAQAAVRSAAACRRARSWSSRPITCRL